MALIASVTAALRGTAVFPVRAHPLAGGALPADASVTTVSRAIEACEVVVTVRAFHFKILFVYFYFAAP